MNITLAALPSNEAFERFIEQADIGEDLPGVIWDDSGRTLIDPAALAAHMRNVALATPSIDPHDADPYGMHEERRKHP